MKNKGKGKEEEEKKKGGGGGSGGGGKVKRWGRKRGERKKQGTFM